MLLPSRVAGRTLDLREPDLARGPEVGRRTIGPSYDSNSVCDSLSACHTESLRVSEEIHLITKLLT